MAELLHVTCSSRHCLCHSWSLMLLLIPTGSQVQVPQTDLPSVFLSYRSRGGIMGHLNTAASFLYLQVAKIHSLFTSTLRMRGNLKTSRQGQKTWVSNCSLLFPTRSILLDWCWQVSLRRHVFWHLLLKAVYGSSYSFSEAASRCPWICYIHTTFQDFISKHEVWGFFPRIN